MNQNNNEYSQIFDDAYKNYYKSHTSPPSNPGGPLLSDNLISIRPIQYTQEEFINKCKVDSEFSEKWGLRIEERELSLEERSFVAQSNHYEVSQNIKMFTGIDEDDTLHNNLDENNIPTKLITITYNDIKTEIYES